MPYVTQSSTRAAGYVITTQNWNESMADLNYLKGHDGAVVIDSSDSTGATYTVTGEFTASSSASVAGGLAIGKTLVASSCSNISGISISAHATGTAKSQHAAGLGLAYVEVVPDASHVPGSSAAWEDWDIGSQISTGAIAVEIRMMNSYAGDNLMGLRQNGSTGNRYFVMKETDSLCIHVAPDSCQYVEIYGEQKNSANFYVLGYWE